MPNGVYPADYVSSVGQTRLLIPDIAVTPLPDMNYIFSDAQVNVFLNLSGGNVKRAAALAKDTLASDTVLLLKVVRTDDLSVDGAKVAAELRAQAKVLRDEADAEAGRDVFDYFDIVGSEPSCYPEAVPAWGRHLVAVGPC